MITNEQPVETKNPFNICTLNEQSSCASCGLQEKLVCKWDKNILNVFHAIAWPPILIAYFGIVLVSILTGVWWPLIAYVVYFFSMFGVFECRGRMIRGSANIHGVDLVRHFHLAHGGPSACIDDRACPLKHMSIQVVDHSCRGYRH